MMSSMVEEAGNRLLTSGPESRDWARRKAGLQSISLKTPNDSPPSAKPPPLQDCRACPNSGRHTSWDHVFKYMNL